MANRPTTGSYDKIDSAESFLPYQHVNVFGVAGTLLGTHAAAADLADLFIVPENSNIKVSGASMKLTGGGTGAATAPAWGIGHSLAGTGDSTIIGTLVWGTRADNTYANFSLTTTDVPAGNVIRLTAIAGTVAETNEIGGFVSVEYKEDWD